MRRHQIPHPDFAVFSRPDDALQHLTTFSGETVVLKASGLAQGKGVYICRDRPQAETVIKALMVERIHGAAGESVVIEQFVEGEEATITAVTDGERVVYLASSQDHKCAFDGDQGPNTGGMGTYAPAPVVTERVLERVDRRIVQPTLEGMRREGTPYRGCLYVGLMIRDEQPTVIEYNCRFGDPETQPVLPMLDGDFFFLLQAAASGDVRGVPVQQRPGAAACVVLTSGGYPGRYETGKTIRGLAEVAGMENLFVFHAGTRKAQDGSIITSGGRVLGITGFGDRLIDAVRIAYAAVGRISFEGRHFRRDIGHRALKRPLGCEEDI
jgi:phosphoribosylamine--glycine ligase